MKKYRKCKNRRPKKKTCRAIRRRGLRSGSKTVKQHLLETSGVCDICGSKKNLQLHHKFLIRHGFKTRLERCCLLCDVCHHTFHIKWDKYLDMKFKENPNADFNAIYEELKTK